MSAEMMVLLLLPALGVVTIGFGGAARVTEYGWSKTFVGARDNLEPFRGKYQQRVVRANENFVETLAWAVGLLLLIEVTGVGNEISALGAWVYFWSRVVYVPIYLTGVPLIRSFVWTFSLIGLGMVASPVISAL